MANLTILFQADVSCAWCGRITGKKFLTSSDPVSQRLLKKNGKLITHGICPLCHVELFNTENIKRGVCV